MIPTVNGNNLYQVGNDYEQKPEMFVTSSYADGIFTEVSGASVEDVLNTRILNVNVSAAVGDDDYATAKFLGPQVEEAEV